MTESGILGWITVGPAMVDTNERLTGEAAAGEVRNRQPFCASARTRSRRIFDPFFPADLRSAFVAGQKSPFVS